MIGGLPMSNFVFPNVVKQNDVEDEFLLFVRKHNGFQIEMIPFCSQNLGEIW
jgi:hypothetical protein